MVRVRFTKDHQGYATGEVHDFDPGIADAFVEWAQVATYVTDEPAKAVEAAPDTVEAKAIDAPPSDKMMHEPPKRKGRPPGSKNKPKS
jgi:hypothetical protein